MAVYVKKMVGGESTSLLASEQALTAAYDSCRGFAGHTKLQFSVQTREIQSLSLCLDLIVLQRLL